MYYCNLEEREAGCQAGREGGREEEGEKRRSAVEERGGEPEGKAPLLQWNKNCAVSFKESPSTAQFVRSGHLWRMIQGWWLLPFPGSSLPFIYFSARSEEEGELCNHSEKAMRLCRGATCRHGGFSFCSLRCT